MLGIAFFEGRRFPMRMNQSQPKSEQAKADPTYRSLYRIGGVAASLMVLVTILHIGVFFVVGLPGNILEWFELFESSPLDGLLAFELLLVVYVVLSIPLALALYAALHRTNPSLMSISLALALIGAVAFIISRPAFEMLSLSNSYAVATTDAQRAGYIAAGEATFATFSGTPYWLSYILGSIGGLMISAVMLQGAVFSKTTAYLRLASGVLDFGIFVPTIGLFIALLSVFCLMGFNILVAWRLLQIGRIGQGG
jgi:fumarate reductase subunit D